MTMCGRAAPGKIAAYSVGLFGFRLSDAEGGVDIQVGTRALLLFDGLGISAVEVIRRLRHFYAMGEFRDFLGLAAVELDKVFDYAHSTGIPDVSREFDLREWLAGPQLPPATTAENSVVAALVGHIYQLCLLQPQVRLSRDGNHVAALGHSLGLHAAVVAALEVRRAEEFAEVGARSIRLLAMGLLRVHQVAAEPPASALARQYAAANPWLARPAPMAALTGVSSSQVRELLDEWHATCERADEARIPLVLGLINSPRMQALSGSTDDLLHFYFKTQGTAWQGKQTWSFIPGTAPFHNPGLEAALRLLRDDMDFVGPGTPGTEFRFPVYATNGTGDLALHEDPAVEVTRLSAVEAVDWPSTVDQAMRAHEPDLLLDFGPGVAALAFTRDCLRAQRQRVRTVSAQQPFLNSMAGTR